VFSRLVPERSQLAGQLTVHSQCRAGSRVILLHRKGFLGSPYIAAVAVVEEFRGNGIGAAMLDFADQAFSGARHAFLCVSSFNPRAQRLYEQLGYRKVGELQDSSPMALQNS